MNEHRGNNSSKNSENSSGFSEFGSNDKLWEENTGSMLYNLKSKSLNFGNLKATQYKYNKSIYMPKPEADDVELSHQLRKTEMLRIFNRAIGSKKGNPKSKNVAKDVTKCQGQPNTSPRYNKNSNSESNLSRDELIGLKNLKARISNKEFVIVDTDKTKKFAALTPEQYVESGLQHTSKDIQIEPERVKRVQNVVNDHVWWLREMTNCGNTWGHEARHAKNMADKGEQTCHMSLLIKDHKKWSLGSSDPIPSRPVISGNNGLNCHMSEIISHII